MPRVESVTAPFILLRTWDAMSVRRMREFTSGEDFDILDDGSFSERTRHDCAGGEVREVSDINAAGDVLMTC